jgi:hypothetical protein
MSQLHPANDNLREAEFFFMLMHRHSERYEFKYFLSALMKFLIRDFANAAQSKVAEAAHFFGLLERDSSSPNFQHNLRASCAQEHGGNPCPGGRGFNNAPVGAPLGATAAQASAAGCAPGTAAGAFCQSSLFNSGGPINVQGNLGRNALRGFPLQQLDLAIHREFLVGDRFRLRFEGDIFNVLNHPNFSSPQSFLSLPNFGIANSMLNSSFGTGNASTGGGYNPLYSLGGPRSVQLALKLIF